MIERGPEWLLAVWASLVWFITANIEASVGVLVAAFGGALWSSMRADKSLFRAVWRILAGVAVGLACAKLLVEFVDLRDAPNSRAAVAFLAALFSEQIVGAVDRALRRGDLLKTLINALPWSGKRN